MVAGVNWAVYPSNGKRYRCLDCSKKYAAEWRKNHPRSVKRKSRTQSWKRKGVKLTYEEFETKLESQAGLCAICGGPPGEKGLHADHDHSTGMARDLLCPRCNYAIGVLESPLFLGYLDYLRKWSPEKFGEP